jgi:hypothetical protein
VNLGVAGSSPVGRPILSPRERLPSEASAPEGFFVSKSENQRAWASGQCQLGNCLSTAFTGVQLTRTRDALLPRLISGKLRVDDLAIQFPPSMADAAQ